MRRARISPALAALALLALGAACSKAGDGDAGRLSVDGRAEVVAPGGEAVVVQGSRILKVGERVEVLEGTATIRLDRGRELELRTGTGVVLEEAAAEGDLPAVQPALLGGDLLVHAPQDAPQPVTVAGAEVIVAGDAQVSQGAAVVVTSYVGEVELRSEDGPVAIRALRQLTLPAREPVPVSYNADDPWNRRFLSEAIELGNELEARSIGFTAQLGATDGRTSGFLVGLLPALDGQPGYAGLFDPARAPGESLVGAAITLEGTRGTFAERWAGVFGFRDQGAQWGLVAYDQGVTRAPLLAAVEAAINRGPRPFEVLPLPGDETPPDEGVAAPGGGGGGGGGSPGSGSGGAPVTSTPAPPPTPTPTAPPPVPTTVSPPTPPNPNIGPLNTGIPILDNTINALVETLSGLLRSLGDL